MIKELFDWFTSSIYSYFFALAIGGILSFIVTKWSMKKNKDDSLLIASEGIKSTSDRILNIEQIVKELDKNIRLMKSSKKEKIIPLYFDKFLSKNPQLSARLAQGAAEKSSTGKFIKKYMSNDTSIAIDCGTSAAWAFYEIMNDGYENIKILTNNIFVATTISEKYQYSDNADIWGVNENASNCKLTSGMYYPSYGAILETGDSAYTYYINELNTIKPNIIILGGTSFRVDHGPSARSGANRKFKECMLRYVADNPDVILFLLMDTNKIGIKIGEPCSIEIWSSLISRENVFVLCGSKNIRLEIEQMVPAKKAILKEEIRSMIEKQVKFKMLLVDCDGKSLDLKKDFI